MTGRKTRFSGSSSSRTGSTTPAILNATRSTRYRYNVREVRGKTDIIVLRGEVYLDGAFYANFIRFEYRAGRLTEVAREAGRFVRDELIARVRLDLDNNGPQADVKLHYCPWIDAHQVEIWQTLEPPGNSTHDIQVLDMMGRSGSITRVRAFDPYLQEVKSFETLSIAFRESDVDIPLGYQINNPQWDNNFLRSHQVPNTPDPSSDQNTVNDGSYLITFRRGWYFDIRDVAPVRYRNALLEDGDPERRDDNIVEMKWVIQRELASSLVYFHEVTVQPGCVEGTHRHIGSEELYFITEGEGTVYMGLNDDPNLAAFPVVTRNIFGLGPIECHALPASPGKGIFTKSGGIHGIRNTGTQPLRFVAFGYQTS